jgi:hypothetical protein
MERGVCGGRLVARRGSSVTEAIKLMTNKSMSYESLRKRSEYLHVFAAVAGIVGILVVLVSAFQTMSLGGSATLTGLVFLVGGGGPPTRCSFRWLLG